MSSPAVAVVDLGSNSIKILVAARGADGAIETKLQHTIDARISAGISREHPRLAEEAMARGLAAVQDLLARAAPFAPERTLLVATSAVREAENGTDFRARVRAATGHDLRILGGGEEARFIGRGLTVDPALAALRDFYVFDLGGGSLECLAFRERDVAQASSLPLGCVRLTERFVAEVEAPFAPAARDAVMRHVREVLEDGGFRFALPGAPGVFAGGTMTTARAVLGARTGRTLAETPAVIGIAELRALLDSLAPLPLAERRKVPGLPPARADVFPAALATLLAVAEAAGLPLLHHSFYNLRYGLAAELLA